MKSVMALVLALAMAACTGPVRPQLDPSNLPPDALNYGGFGQGYNAFDYAAYAFASPARTQGRPGAAAAAVAVVEFMAGTIPGSPRWVNIPALDQDDIIFAKGDLRNLLGIPATARSQAVVDGLIGAARAYAANDPVAVDKALTVAIFTQGPERTTDILTNMPYLQRVNLTTLRISQHQYEPNDFCFICSR
jgi:hypothetical protein